MPQAQMGLLDEADRKKIVRQLRSLDKVAAAVSLVEQCGVECTDRKAVLNYLYGEYQKLHSVLWPNTAVAEEVSN